MGYWEKLDEVEDRRDWWIKPAAWVACVIGGGAVYLGHGPRDLDNARGLAERGFTPAPRSRR